MRPTFEEYEYFIFSLRERFLSIQYSTLVFQRQKARSATVRGDIIFAKGVRLRAVEILDFDVEDNFIRSYSYAVYRNEEKLYWYDSFPHPHVPDLASTHPHHKHIPPDIKHHRIPAPNLSFAQPNLPFLIQEIETTLLIE
jgi:hypothetical protein